MYVVRPLTAIMKPVRNAEHNHITSSSATYQPGRTPKALVLRRLKKFIGSSQASSSSHAQPNTIRTTPTETESRRAEALKACGLLGQSVKYGGPYRDEGDDDDAKTIISSEKQADDELWKMKDLLDFDEKTELPKGAEDYECSINTIEGNLISVDSPETPPVPLQRQLSVSTSSDTSSIVESETSTLSPLRAPIRVRSLGSLTEELDQIKDEESRRLTELAFFS